MLVGLAGERDVIMLLMGLEERAFQSRRSMPSCDFSTLGLRASGPALTPLALGEGRALGASEGREDEAVALYRSLLERAGDDAVSDAEAFGSFLRAAPLTPARAADLRWLFDWRLFAHGEPDGRARRMGFTEKRDSATSRRQPICTATGGDRFGTDRA